MRVCAVGVTRRRDVFCHSNRRANQNAGREKHEVQSAVQTGYMGNEIGDPNISPLLAFRRFGG